MAGQKVHSVRLRTVHVSCAESRRLVTATVGGRRVSVELKVSPPRDNGWRMGFGYIEVRSLRLGGDRLISAPLPFNWIALVPEEPALVEVVLGRKSGIHFLRRCWAPEVTDDDYSKISCREELLTAKGAP